jgi:hypothetical protein
MENHGEDDRQLFRFGMAVEKKPPDATPAATPPKSKFLSAPLPVATGERQR